MDMRDRERERESEGGAHISDCFRMQRTSGVGASGAQMLIADLQLIPGYVGVAVGHVALDVQGIWVIKKSRKSDLWQWPNALSTGAGIRDRAGTEKRLISI